MTGSGWQVTSQITNQIENTTAGQTLIGVRVFFITGNGNEGSVFIPDTLYNKKNVHSRVKAQADLIDDIGALSENYG